MLGLFGLLGAIFAGAIVEGLSSRQDEEDLDENHNEDEDIDTGNLLDEEDSAEDPFRGLNPFRPGSTGSGFGFPVIGQPADTVPDHADDFAHLDLTATEDVTAVVTGSDAAETASDTAETGESDAGETTAIVTPPVQAGGSEDDFLDGDDDPDLIHGGPGNDQINSRGGNDSIYGGEGNDIVLAGSGDDLAYGGSGNDELHGEAGNDSLFGDAGDDRLMGHEGDDHLDGGEGNDTLLGGEGDDTLLGGEGDDWLWGGEGDDLLIGGPGSDTLDGGAGNDTLWGAFPEGDDGETDFLNGGDGDDVLYLGAGDYGNGGAGADSFVLSQWLGEGGIATITDYDATEDEIVLVYDASVHVSPEISVGQNESGDTSIIRIDGFVVAEVNGQVDPGEIRLLAA